MLRAQAIAPHAVGTQAEAIMLHVATAPRARPTAHPVATPAVKAAIAEAVVAEVTTAVGAEAATTAAVAPVGVGAAAPVGTEVAPEDMDMDANQKYPVSLMVSWRFSNVRKI